MPKYTKADFPVSNVRRFLEPGPIVLVSSAHKGESNIMTMGWHMIMEFVPSLIGCYIWTENHSFEMIRKSRQCVINIPTEDIAAKVVKIGNSSGSEIDKFAEFGLTARPGEHVRAPLIDECFASFECKLVDVEPDPEVQPVRVRGGEGACRDLAEISEDDPLPRRRRVHDLRRRDR